MLSNVLFEGSVSTDSAFQIVRKNSLSAIISFNEFYPEPEIHNPYWKEKFTKCNNTF